MIDAALIVAGSALTIALRLLPYRLLRVMGVDAWFHVLYADAVRAQRRLPAQLTSFLLEQPHQRYPPLLALLLALMPAARARRVQPWIAPVIDAIHLVLLIVTARMLGWDTTSTVVAALVFATTPTLVLEHSTLSPRALACVLFTVFMLALFRLLTDGGAWWFVMAAFAGALVLLTNKLATQLLALTIVVVATVETRLDVAALGLVIIGGAWALSGGFYSEVSRGHADILKFWWPRTADVTAHQVYDSPIYAGPRPARVAATRLYQRGWSGAVRLAKALVVNAPWLLVVPASWRPDFLGLWLAITLGAVVVTAFVPPMRFLGQGARYLKFATFPAALLVGHALSGWPHVIGAATLVILNVLVVARLLSARAFEELSAPFHEVVEFLRGDPRPRVATIPSHYAPAVACLAGKQVLTGGFSSGYDELAVWSPVLLQPVEKILDAHDVALLLVDTRYVDPAHVLNEPFRYRLRLECGPLQLFERTG